MDSSAWIGHFRQALPGLAALIAADQVVGHSVVLGELAVGGLPTRQATLMALAVLPAMIEAQPTYALRFLERHRLYNIGLTGRLETGYRVRVVRSA